MKKEVDVIEFDSCDYAYFPKTRQLVGPLRPAIEKVKEKISKHCKKCVVQASCNKPESCSHFTKEWNRIQKLIDKAKKEFNREQMQFVKKIAKLKNVKLIQGG